METWRLFLALPVCPPPALLQAADDLRNGSMGLKPIPLEDWHMTLKFLGEQDIAAIPAIIDAVGAAARGAVVSRGMWSGVGVFPDRRHPTVLWAGVDGCPELGDLARRIETALEPLGIRREQRPLTPHLTLARIKSRPGSDLFSWLDRHRDDAFGPAVWTDLNLYRSELHADGPTYTAIQTWPLASTGIALTQRIRQPRSC